MTKKPENHHDGAPLSGHYSIPLMSAEYRFDCKGKGAIGKGGYWQWNQRNPYLFKVKTCSIKFLQALIFCDVGTLTK